VIDNGRIINNGKPEIVFENKETGIGLSLKGKVISISENELTIKTNALEHHNFRPGDSIK